MCEVKKGRKFLFSKCEIDAVVYQKQISALITKSEKLRYLKKVWATLLQSYRQY